MGASRTQHTGDPESAPLRPRFLTRSDDADIRAAVARLLAAEVAASGQPKAAIARHIGRDERVVRDMCGGVQPITVSRAVALGPLGARFLRACADLAIAASAPRLDPERHVLAITRELGDVARALEEVSADGHVSDAERALVRREATELLERVTAMLRDLAPP